jgi:peptidoglycan/LPS O-acetylase OafA/YrhL
MTATGDLLHAPSAPMHNRHLPGLDGLRGIACLLVFFYHLRWAAGDPPLRIGSFDLLPIFKNCDVGVAIFFALSGLLLSLPFWKAIDGGTQWPSFGPYLWRRACRIIPAYYACLIVIYLFEGGTYTLYGFIDFLLHATFLHTFSDQSYLSHYGPLWTIGIEFQFYLLLPMLMAFAGWLSKRLGIIAACMGLIVFTYGVDVIAKMTLNSIEPSVPDRFLASGGNVLEMGTIFHYLKYFAFGMVGAALSLHWRRAGERTVPAICGVLAAAGAFLILAFSGEGVWRTTALTGWPLNLAAFALLAASLPAVPALSRFFELRPLVFAGEISYGVYLWHDLVLKSVFAGTLPGRLQGWPLVLAGGLIALGISTLIAWLSFRFLEQPAMRAPCPSRIRLGNLT